MALLTDATGEYATAANPWSGGGVTFSMWVRRVGGSSSSKHLSSVLVAANGENYLDRINVLLDGSYHVQATYAAGAGATNDVSTATYSTSAWFHVAGQYAGSGGSITECEAFLDGTGTASPGTGSRTPAGLDQLRLGTSVTNGGAYELAHFALFNTELSGSQITELQTKQPNAITGASPIVYYPLLSGDGFLSGSTYSNQGTGGATYDLTLQGTISISGTNDGSLPSLSAPSPGGGPLTGGLTRSILAKGRLVA